MIFVFLNICIFRYLCILVFVCSIWVVFGRDVSAVSLLLAGLGKYLICLSVYLYICVLVNVCIRVFEYLCFSSRLICEGNFSCIFVVSNLRLPMYLYFCVFCIFVYLYIFVFVYLFICIFYICVFLYLGIFLSYLSI